MTSADVEEAVGGGPAKVLMTKEGFGSNPCFLSKLTIGRSHLFPACLKARPSLIEAGLHVYHAELPIHVFAVRGHGP